MAKILVVDDDPDIRSIVSFKLARDGHEVVAEADGESGLAKAKEVLPDLVILDWMMPKMTGVEVCQALRADERFRSTPIILLTARAQEFDLKRGFAAGATDYITKPFSPRELVLRVEARLTRPYGAETAT